MASRTLLSLANPSAFPAIPLSRPFGAVPRTLLAYRKKHHYSLDIPSDTPRVTLDDGSIFIHRKIPKAPVAETSQLPPALRSQWSKFDSSIVLTREQVAEMRQLRSSDPDKWTASKLSKRFSVSPQKVLLLAPLSKDSERRRKVAEVADQQFLNSTFSRQVAILDRIRRKAKW